MSEDYVNVSITLRPSTLKKYLNPTFVETGFFDGRCIQMAKDAGFENIYGIELDTKYVEYCKNRFANDTNVHIWSGDSIYKLWDMISNIKVPITFWLDAHFRTVKGKILVPLLEEIEIIGNHPNSDQFTILIDDRRLMGSEGRWKKVTEQAVKNKLSSVFSNPVVRYEDSNAAKEDIIVARNKK